MHVLSWLSFQSAPTSNPEVRTLGPAGRSTQVGWRARTASCSAGGTSVAMCDHSSVFTSRSSSAPTSSISTVVHQPPRGWAIDQLDARAVSTLCASPSSGYAGLSTNRVAYLRDRTVAYCVRYDGAQMHACRHFPPSARRARTPRSPTCPARAAAHACVHGRGTSITTTATGASAERTPITGRLRLMG